MVEVDQACDLVVAQSDGEVGTFLLVISNYRLRATDLHLPEVSVYQIGILASENAIPGAMHVILEYHSVAHSAFSVPYFAIKTSFEKASKVYLDGVDRRVILTLVGMEATGMDGDFDQVLVELDWGNAVIQRGFVVRCDNIGSEMPCR